MADAEGLEQEADATALGEPQFTEPQEAEAAQQFVQQIPEGQAPDQTEMYQQQLDPQQQGPFSQIEGGEGSEQPAAEPPIAVAPEAAPAPAAAPPAAGQTVVPVVYEEEFEVEQIVTERILETGAKQFLVKWVGYPHDQNTWEPAEHMAGSDEALAAYKKEQRKQRKLDEKRKKEEKKRQKKEKKKKRKNMDESDSEVSGESGDDDSSDEWCPPSDLEGQITPYKDEYGSSGNEGRLRKRGRSGDEGGMAEDPRAVRFGQVIQLKEGCGPKYAQLCREMQAIPEINQCFRACNIKNFTIFHKAGLLFCFVEYVGTDIATDFNRLATDPQMKYFWDMSREYQEPMYFHEPHEWWSRLDELFHA